MQTQAEHSATKSQPPDQTLPYPEGLLGKLVFKTPLLMIRFGLQKLMGERFLVITHIGRKSGQPRHTMTEMHRAENGKLYAPCAYGEKAQWYKNIVADSHVTIQTAKRTFSAHAQRVTDDNELLMVVSLIIERTPFFSTFLKRLQIDNTPQSILANKDKLYLIRFDGTTDTTPPPLKADLRWVWLIMLAILAFFVGGMVR